MPTPIRATTQEHLDIEDVTNNIIILKDGSAAMVLRVSAVNFNLLSEDEQDAIIFAYAALLNSLSFPIQVLIRSQKKDITNYVKLLKAQEARQLNPTMKNRITQYRQFVEKIVKERNVLDKKFYVVIPFFRTELGISSAKPSLNPLKSKKTSLPYDKNYIIQKALNSLEPKRDHLFRQFTRLGLSVKQLATQELIQLLYSVYNPDSSEGVQTVSSAQYQTPIVQSTKPTTQPQNQTTQPTPTLPQPNTATAPTTATPPPGPSPA